jgi:hypothetical protein
MNAFWRQIQAPRHEIEQANSEANDLGFSLIDPRNNTDNWPVRVYGIRPGSTHGLKVFDPESLCTITGLCTNQEGYGEQISSYVYGQTLTHVELQQVGSDVVSGCVEQVNCGDGNLSTDPRRLFNNSADIYQCIVPNGRPSYVVAVAAGFPAGVQIVGSQHVCRFQDYQYHPMIALFDVTRTGASPTDPTLLRVGTTPHVQPIDDSGHAFSITVYTQGSGSTASQFAYVGDIYKGRILVYDVSYNNIFPAPTVPYPISSLLFPVGSVVLPKDPYDGQPPNVIALKTQGNYLYCALGRAGVAVLDVSQPSAPQLCKVLDTPGLALGLTFRTLAGNHTQMVVGDSRCGIRLYE